MVTSLRRDQKPALLLDDDQDYASWIAKSIRVIGGLPTVFFKSIEGFYRGVGLPPDPGLPDLAQKLTSYSSIVSDNNFAGASPDGRIEGFNFLVTKVGPATNLITDPEEKPYLVCFAPSSSSVIQSAEQDLWNRFRIASFNKMHEFPALGIATRISREYGVPLSRQAVVEGICGQDRNDDPVSSPSRTFFMNVFLDITLDRISYGGSAQEQCAGPAIDVKWEDIVKELAMTMEIDQRELLTRIEREVDTSRHSIEGSAKRTKES